MPLSDLKILMTRPVGFEDQLNRLIQAQGGLVIHLPTIACQPVVLEHNSMHVIKTLHDFWGAIFVSQSAVQFAFQWIQAQWGHKRLACYGFAPGLATAACLSAQGLSTVYAPEQPPFNSESLLALPQLQHVHQKKIVIFKGEQGRSLLFETLKHRQAEVHCVDLYKRVIPKESIEPAKRVLREHRIDSIVVASQSGIENLMILIPNRDHKILFQIPMVVISERLASFAKKVGFQTVWISPTGEDNAILDLILRCYRSGRRTYEKSN